MSQQRSGFCQLSFFCTVGRGKEMVFFQKGQPIYTQGDASDDLFVIQQGTIRLSIQSQAGRQATLDMLNAGDIVGQNALAGESSRSESASAMTDCTLLRIKKNTALAALKRSEALASRLWSYLLMRNMRYEQDLVAQRCNRSRERLARVLSLSAHFDEHGSTSDLMPRIKQETLAEMVGTTRARVSHFMKEFKNAGLISYAGSGVRIHRSLLAFCAR